MGQLSGPRIAFHGQTSEVDTSQHIALGTIGYGADSNDEFLYVDFSTSFAAGEWVVYDEAYLATTMNTTALGPVGVVVGSPSASDTFGWIQIKGVHTAANATSGTGDNELLQGLASAHVGTHASSTPGNIVFNAYSRSAASTATSPTNGGALITVQLDRPYVVGEAVAFSTV